MQIASDSAFIARFTSTGEPARVQEIVQEKDFFQCLDTFAMGRIGVAGKRPMARTGVASDNPLIRSRNFRSAFIVGS